MTQDAICNHYFILQVKCFLESVSPASWLINAAAEASELGRCETPVLEWPPARQLKAESNCFWASSDGSLYLFHSSVSSTPLAAVLVHSDGVLETAGPAFRIPSLKASTWSLFACCLQPGGQSPGRSTVYQPAGRNNSAPSAASAELDDTATASPALTAQAVEQAVQQWLLRTPAADMPTCWDEVFPALQQDGHSGAGRSPPSPPPWLAPVATAGMIDDTARSDLSSRSARRLRHISAFEWLGGDPLLLPPRLHPSMLCSPNRLVQCVADELNASAWSALHACSPTGLCEVDPVSKLAASADPWWDIRVAARVCGWTLLAQRRKSASRSEGSDLQQIEMHALVHCMASVGAERVGELLRSAGDHVSLQFLGSLTVTLLARTAHLARVRTHAIAARAAQLHLGDRFDGDHKQDDADSRAEFSLTTACAAPVPGMVSSGVWSVPRVDSRLVNYLLVLHKTLCHAIRVSSKQKIRQAGSGESPRQGPRRTSDDVSAGISEDDSQTLRAHDDMLTDLGLSGNAILESLLVRHHMWETPLATSRSNTYGQPPRSARGDSARASLPGSQTFHALMREPELNFVAGVPWVLQFLAVPNAWIEVLAQADFSQAMHHSGPSASMLSAVGGMADAGMGHSNPAVSPSVLSSHTGRESAGGGGVRKPPLAQSQTVLSNSATPANKTHNQPPGLHAASKVVPGPLKGSRLRVSTHSSSNASSSALRAAAIGSSTPTASVNHSHAPAPLGGESAPNTGASRTSATSNPISSGSTTVRSADAVDSTAAEQPSTRATARDSTSRAVPTALAGARKAERSAPAGPSRGIPLSPHSRLSFATQDGTMWGEEPVKSRVNSTLQSTGARSVSTLSGAAASVGSGEELSISGLASSSAPTDYVTPRNMSAADNANNDTPFSLNIGTPGLLDGGQQSRQATEDRGARPSATANAPHGKDISAAGSVLSRSSSERSELTASLSRGAADSTMGSARSGFVAIPKLTLSPTTRNRNSAVLRTGGDNTGRNSSSVVSSARGGDTARRSAARVTIAAPGQWATPSARGIALDRIASGTAYGGMHGGNWANQSVISMAASQAITVTGVAAAARRVRLAWSALMDSEAVQETAKTARLLWVPAERTPGSIQGAPLPPTLGLVNAMEVAAESATIGSSKWWQFWQSKTKSHEAEDASSDPVHASSAGSLSADLVMGPLVATEAVLTMSGNDMTPKKLAAFSQGKPAAFANATVASCTLGLWGHLLRQLPGTSRQEVTAASSIDYSLERVRGPNWDFPDLLLQIGASLQPVACVVERQPAFAALSDHAAEFSSAVPAARALPLLVAAASDAAASLYRKQRAGRQQGTPDNSCLVPGCCLPQSWAPIVAPITAWDWLRPMVRGKRIHSMPMNSLVPLAAHSAAMTTAAHDGLLDALRRTILAVHSVGAAGDVLVHVALPLAQSAALLACIFGAASSTLRHPRLIELLANHDKLMPVPPLRLAAMRASVGSCLLAVSSALAAVASAVQQCSTILAASLAASADSSRSQDLAQVLSWIAHWGHGAAHMSTYSVVLHLSGLYTRAKQAAQQHAGTIKPVFPEALLAGSARLLLQCAKAHERAASLWHLRDLNVGGGQPTTPRRSPASSQHQIMAHSAILTSARLATGLAAWRHLPSMSLVANPLTDTSHAAADLQLAARVAASMPSNALNAQHAFPLLLDADGMAQLWVADGTRAQCAVLQYALQKWIISLASQQKAGDSDATSQSNARNDSLLLLVIQGVLRTNRGSSAARPVSDAQRAQNNPSPDSTDTVLSVRPAGSHPGHSLLEDTLALMQQRALRGQQLRPSPHKRRLGTAFVLGADVLESADSGDAAAFAFETSLLHDAATTSTLVSTGFMTVMENLLRAASAPVPSSVPSINSGIALPSERVPVQGRSSTKETLSANAAGSTPRLPTSPLSAANSAQKGRPPMPNKTPSLGARSFGMLQASAGAVVTSPTGSAASSKSFSSSRSRSPMAGGAAESLSSSAVSTAPTPDEAPPAEAAKPVQYIDMDDLGDESAGNSSWDSDGFEIGGFLSEPAADHLNVGSSVVAPSLALTSSPGKAPPQTPTEKPVHVIDMGSDTASTVSWGSDSEYNLDGSYAPASGSASPSRSPSNRLRSSSLGAGAAKPTTPQHGTSVHMAASPDDPAAHPNPAGICTPPIRKRAASSTTAPRTSHAQTSSNLFSGIVIPRLAVVDKADAAANAIGGVAAGGIAGAVPTYALPEHLQQEPLLLRLLQNPAVHIGLVHAALCALITVGGASLHGAFSRRFPSQDASSGHPHAQLHPPSAAALKGGMLVFATDSLATSVSMDGRLMHPHKVAQSLGDEPAMLLSADDLEDEDDGLEGESDESNEDVVVVVSKPFGLQLDSRRLLDFDASHSGGHLPTGSQDRLELSVSDDGSAMGAARHSTLGNDSAILHELPSIPGALSQSPQHRGGSAGGKRPKRRSRPNSANMPSKDQHAQSGMALSSAGRAATGATVVSEAQSRLLSESMLSIDSQWSADDSAAAPSTPKGARRLQRMTPGALLPLSPPQSFGGGGHSASHALLSALQHQAAAFQRTPNSLTHGRVQLGQHRAPLPLPFNVVYVLQRHLNEARFAPLLPALCRLTAASGLSAVRLLRLLCRGCMDVSVYGEGARLGSGAYGEVVEVTWVPPLTPSPTPLVAMAQQNRRMWSPSLAAFGIAPETDAAAAGAGGHSLRDGGGPASVAIPPPPFPLAAKQVQLPKSADDQISVGDLFTSATLYQHVLSEHRYTKQLPPIPRLWDFGLTADSYWLVTERCATNLSGWRHSLGTQLSQDHVPICLAVFAAVARGVHWLHERGVTHYDLKADNVLLRWKATPKQLVTAIHSTLRPGRMPLSSADDPTPHALDGTAPRWLRGALAEQLASEHATAQITGHRPRERTGHNTDQGAADDELRSYSVSASFNPSDLPTSPSSTRTGGSADSVFVRHLVPNHLVALTDFGEVTYTPGLPARAGWCSMSPGTECIKAPEVLALGGRDRKTLRSMDIGRERLRGSTHTADVWSLGCMLIELLTGKSPFADECENEYATFYTRVTGGAAPGTRSSSTHEAPATPPPVLDAALMQSLQCVRGADGEDELGVMRLLDMCFTRDPVRRASADVVAAAAEVCAVAAARKYL